MKKILLILTALIGSSCATPVKTFPYHWYYLDPSGALGAEPNQDFPLSLCLPLNGNHPCVLMLKSDFERMYQEYLSQ